VGLRAIIYYMTTTVCAVMLGIALVTTIKPGNDPEAHQQHNNTKLVTKETLTSDTLLDLIRYDLLPKKLDRYQINIAQMTDYPSRTFYSMKKEHVQIYAIVEVKQHWSVIGWVTKN
jgi:hypothetical protein